jgi:hypothetical protein
VGKGAHPVVDVPVSLEVVRLDVLVLEVCASQEESARIWTDEKRRVGMKSRLTESVLP